MWPAALLALSFLVGFLATVSGTGGGVLFVPFVAGLFPFHIDFVRGAGLLVAMCAALAAGPRLLRSNMASLRLAVPMGLVSSLAAIFGAMIGLAMSPQAVQISLGACIMVICTTMILVHNTDYPRVGAPGALSAALALNGLYHEHSSKDTIRWSVRHAPGGLCIFVGIGLMAGMFGIGGGWAMVPTLNLLMGAPLKLSVATGKIILGITDTSAAWVYLNRGAIAPVIVIPSVLGAMAGSALGVRVLRRISPRSVRWVVIIALALAGGRCLIKGITG